MSSPFNALTDVVAWVGGHEARTRPAWDAGLVVLASIVGRDRGLLSEQPFVDIGALGDFRRPSAFTRGEAVS